MERFCKVCGVKVSRNCKSLLCRKHNVFLRGWQSTGKPHPWLGRKHTQEEKDKIKFANTGVIFSDKRKENISKACMGRTSGNKGKKGLAGENHPRWKGGTRLRVARNHAKRRLLGHDILNEQFEGSEGHHIDKVHVVFIPKELHRSVWHSMDKPETMEQINTKVICWLLGVKTQ